MNNHFLRRNVLLLIPKYALVYIKHTSNENLQVLMESDSL